MKNTEHDVTTALLAAGKLAVAARLVTMANTKNLSQRIERLEAALDAYDNEILSLSNNLHNGWVYEQQPNTELD